MAYTAKKMLTDGENKPIPQIYDNNTDNFYPLTLDTIQLIKGDIEVNNAIKQLGTLVEDYYEGNANYSQTYSQTMYGVSIANDGLSSLTFTINGQTRTVYPGEPYNGVFKNGFTSIQITATDNYRMEVLS